MNIRSNLFLATIFLSLFINSLAQENGEKKGKLRFADKIIHSFGLQYNNTFHAKGKFTYKDAPDYSIGGHPCISYGREYIVKYNLTFPSGWGVTTEFVAGNRNFMTYKIHTETGKRIYMHKLWYHSLRPLVDYTYFGGQIKASYMYRLHEKITMQPEVGLKLLKYVPHKEGSIQVTIEADEFGNPVITDGWRWRDLSNDDWYNKFIPELTAGVNFLFHSIKDPRHNFVIGVNGTIGFIDRYWGWQRFDRNTPPEKADILMKYGSSFFALNLGYEFTGFKTPLHKTREYRKEKQANMQYETFDFSKPVHSVGVYFTSGFSYNSRMKDTQGQFSPRMYASSFVPELNIRYSLAAKKGWGFAVEVPIGLFQRYMSYSLRGLIPEETVWADGEAIGPGFSSSGGVSVPYVGATLKLSYLAHIHKNIFIQPEAGIKFMPFVYPVRCWNTEEPSSENIYYIDNDGYTTNIVWLHDKPSISIKHYAVPDITMAVNFMVHGKRPHHNFIFGINANIGLMDRLSWTYHTTEVIPSDLQSSGKHGMKSSYVGFHIGYQFMTAKKKL